MRVSIETAEAFIEEYKLYYELMLDYWRTKRFKARREIKKKANQHFDKAFDELEELRKQAGKILHRRTMLDIAYMVCSTTDSQTKRFLEVLNKLEFMFV